MRTLQTHPEISWPQAWISEPQEEQEAPAMNWQLLLALRIPLVQLPWLKPMASMDSSVMRMPMTSPMPSPYWP